MVDFATPRILRPYAALSHTVIQGKIESPWKIIEFTGRREFGVSISILPAVTESSPARMRNSVVLPHPLGPTIMKNSPWAISTDTPSTAVNAPNLLYRSRIEIAGRVGSGSVTAPSSLASGRVMQRALAGLNLPGKPNVHNRLIGANRRGNECPTSVFRLRACASPTSWAASRKMLAAHGFQ